MLREHPRALLLALHPPPCSWAGKCRRLVPFHQVRRQRVLHRDEPNLTTLSPTAETTAATNNRGSSRGRGSSMLRGRLLVGGGARVLVRLHQGASKRPGQRRGQVALSPKACQISRRAILLRALYLILRDTGRATKALRTLPQSLQVCGPCFFCVRLHSCVCVSVCRHAWSMF